MATGTYTGGVLSPGDCERLGIAFDASFTHTYVTTFPAATITKIVLVQVRLAMRGMP